MPTYVANAGSAAIENNGGEEWTNTSNATGAADGSTADLLFYSEESSPDWLKLSNFGFSVPGSETIVGIQITIRAKDAVSFEEEILGAAEINIEIEKPGGGGGEG